MEISIVPPASLESGLAALRQEQYQTAISVLEAFCHDCAASAQPNSRDHLRAQMHLVKTYAQVGQAERAELLCQQLTTCAHAQVQIWAQQQLRAVTVPQVATAPASVLHQLRQTLPSVGARTVRLLQFLNPLPNVCKPINKLIDRKD